MASSRGLSLATLFLRSSSARRSLFDSALGNFTVAAGRSLRVYDHVLNICRQPYCTFDNSFECGVDQDKFENLRKLVSPSPSHLLTASEFAVAIGFFPRYRELLWLQKISGTDESLADPMWMDTSMTISYKDRAFDMYMNLCEEIRPHFIACPDLQVYGEDPFYSWMAASVDGIIDNRHYLGYDHEYPRSILKIVCIYNFDLSLDTASIEMGHGCPNEHKSKSWQRVPLYFIPQLQGIMEVMGVDEMRFYVWSFSGSSSFFIYRDAKYCDVLKTVLSDFWWKHVLPAKELCNKHKIEDPLHQLRSLKPAPRHGLYDHMLQESKRIADETNALQTDSGNNFPFVLC